MTFDPRPSAFRGAAARNPDKRLNVNILHSLRFSCLPAKNIYFL